MSHFHDVIALIGDDSLLPLFLTFVRVRVRLRNLPVALGAVG
jgi:hypothetical protein